MLPVTVVVVCVAVEALPVNVAVMVPAEKFPEASRATIAEAVLAFVAVVAELETFDAVERARYGEISAKEVDDCNMLRYNAKINLQKAFAIDSNESIIEIKS